MSLRRGLNRLPIALSFLLLCQAAPAQVEVISGETCVEQFEAADDAALRKLVGNQPEPAKLCVYGLLKTYVSRGAAGEEGESRKALALAAKIARAHAAVLPPPSLLNVVARYRRWSPEQKRDKARADGWAEEALRASQGDDDEKALEVWGRVRATYARLGAAWDEAEALSRMGTSYRSLGRRERALAFQNRSLAIRTRLGDVLGMAENFTNIGLVYQDLKMPQKAVTNLRKALDLWRRGQFARGETMTLIFISYLYREAGQREKMAEYLKQLLPISEKSRYLGERNLSALLFEMGERFLELAQPQEAQEAFQQLEQSLQAAEEPPSFKGRFLTAVAYRYEKAARMGEALKYYREAVDVYAGDEYRTDRAETLIFVGIIYKNQGRGVEALGAYREALELFRATGDTLQMAHVYNNMGIVSDRMGKYKNALTFYDEAVSIYERAIEAAGRDEEKNKALRNHVASVLLNVGLTYHNLSQHDKALEYLRRALGGVEQPEQYERAGNLFLALGVTYENLKQFGEAKRYYAEALTAYKSANNIVGVAGALANQGGLHAKDREFPEARALLEQALEVYQKFGNRNEVGGLLFGIASTHLYGNEFDKALPLFREALDISREVSDPELSWKCNMGIALVHMNQIRFHEALKHFRAAVEDIESLREGIGRTPQGVESRIKFFDNKRGPYKGLVGTLLVLSMGSEAGDHKREAFEYADRGKGRGWLDLLAESRALTKVGASSEMVEKLVAARTQMASYEDGLKAELAKPQASRDQGLVAEYQQKLEQVSREERGAAREIETKFPRFAELANPRPVTLAQVQGALLKERQALVEYVTGLPEPVAFVITREGFSAVTLTTNEDELAGTIRALRASLTRDREFDARAAHELYGRLFRPLEGHLGGATTIYVVPDGPLHYLPFEALLTSVDPGRRASSFLLNKYSFAYVPSAGVLRNSLEDQASRDVSGGPRQPLAIFANPTYEPGGGPASLTARGMTPELLDDCQSLHFSPLPYSEEEAKSVARTLGLKFDDVAFNHRGKATEARVKALDLSAYRYVHFATHGLVCERNEDGSLRLQPSLVLAQGGTPSGDARRGDDGFLQMNEILNLNLNADLVTLSACKTGLGERLGGEGLVGLTRAFMYAGTPSVLVSLWNVADKSTPIFMNRFYTNLRAGMKKGEALREAKRWMLENSSHVEVEGGYRNVVTHDHPYFWAPFVLVGASE